MNTYTEAQVKEALSIIEIVWGDKPDYLSLSQTAKELLALSVLRAHDLTKPNR